VTSALAIHEVEDRRSGIAILDVREEPEFAAGHLATSGNIPRAALVERRTELPPRDAYVLVVARSAAEARETAAAVESLGYPHVSWLDAPVTEMTGCVDRDPAARLWKPAPFLEQILPRLLDTVSGGRVLDLAAGAGREAVFLALHGFVVEAVDNDRGILARAEALAARNGVAIRGMVRNLERQDAALGEAAYEVITVFRFLHRPLFPAIAAALAPGGFLVYETYRRGQERFGRPKHPRFLLDDGELSFAFPGLTVEQYEEPGPEEGPITARLLARRPPAR
jgi:rhodanese-related sulfurtransferase